MFQDIVRSRRSVRSYSSQPVKREHIRQCLDAARLAPSACNSQPWRFVVVDEPDLKNKLCREAFSGLYKMNAFAAAAPVIIAVIADRGSWAAQLGGQVRNTRYYLLDLGIACEHLVLQAEELGLGSCWLGWFNERKVKRLLGVPRSKKIDIVISLGYSDHLVDARPRKKLDDIASFNTYPW